MYHLVVRTFSGARYLIRLATLGSGNAYVTSTGSSAGADLRNHLIDPSSVQVRVGEPMHLRDQYGALVRTSRVITWSLERIDVPGKVIRSIDETEDERIARYARLGSNLAARQDYAILPA